MSPPGVTVLILLGRYLEARAKRRAAAALRALLSLGAKDVAVPRDGHEMRIPASQLGVGDVFVVRPGEKIATDGMVESGDSAVDASIVLDKTGTITTGRMSLAGVAAVPGKDPAQVTSGQRMPGRWSMMGANPIRHGNC